MYRLALYKITAILFMCVLSNNTFALTCERTSRSAEGFNRAEYFDSWHPKEIYLNEREFTDAGKGSKAMVQTKELWSTSGNLNIMNYRLLPNGKLIAKLKDKAGFMRTGHVSYKCDKNSNEVRQLIASGSTGENSSDNKPDTHNAKLCNKDNPQNCDDTELCRFGTTSRSGSPVWETGHFSAYAKEAKSRGLTCGVGNGTSDTNNSSTSKLDKAKSTCTELGFTLGTEKHGECVLKMMDN